MAGSDTDVARIRLVLARELDTISQYEALAREAQSPEVKQFFVHLATEEKEHVAEATDWLRRLDPEQNAHFAKDYTAAHFAGAREAAPRDEGTVLPDRLPEAPQAIVHAIPAPAGPYVGRLTVGPLKNRNGDRHA